MRIKTSKRLLGVEEIQKKTEKPKNQMFNVFIDKYKKLPPQAKASLWFLICSFLTRAISTITTPIFTRILYPEEYGQFSVYNSWNGIISVIISMNLSYGVLTQGIVRHEDRKDEYTSSLMGLSTILILAWFAIYCVNPTWWNNLFSLPTPQMIAMFISIWAAVVFAFWSTGQRIDYKYTKMVTLTLTMSVINPIIEYYIITHFENRVTVRIVVSSILSACVYFPLFLIPLRKGKKFYNGEYWKYAILFNLPLIPHYLSQVVLNSSDRIMISRMVGENQAGIYNLAYSLSTIMLIFNHSINSTMEPWMYRKIRDKRPQDITKIVYPLFILVACLNLSLIAFAPEIIAIFAPVPYYDAIWIIPPVAMSVYFQFTFVSFAVFEFYFKKTHFVAIATFSGAITNIILNFIFIKLFGYYAAGYTTLVCYMIFSAAHYIFMKRIVQRNFNGVNVYPLRRFFLITCVFMLIGFALLLTYSDIVVRYCAIIVSLIILFIMRGNIKHALRSVMQIRKMED